MLSSPGTVAVNIKPDAKFRVQTAGELLFCFAQEVLRWNDLHFKINLSFGSKITE
jgi:hypothetical protein